MWLNCVSINIGLVCLWWLKVDWSDTPDEPDWSNLTDECNGPKRLFRLEPKCPEIPRPSARSHWSNSSETSRKDSECAWCAWECHLDMGKWCWDSVTGWVGLVHVLWTIFCFFLYWFCMSQPMSEPSLLVPRIKKKQLYTNVVESTWEWCYGTWWRKCIFENGWEYWWPASENCYFIQHCLQIYFHAFTSIYAIQSIFPRMWNAIHIYIYV